MVRFVGSVYCAFGCVFMYGVCTWYVFYVCLSMGRPSEEVPQYTGFRRPCVRAVRPLSTVVRCLPRTWCTFRCTVPSFCTSLCFLSQYSVPRVCVNISAEWVVQSTPRSLPKCLNLTNLYSHLVRELRDQRGSREAIRGGLPASPNILCPCANHI